MERLERRITPAVFLVAGLLSLLILSAACNRSRTSSEMPKPSVAKFKPGPIHYVALGDSTGAGLGARNGGYVARLFRRLTVQRPDSRLKNLCVSGATTADVLANQLERLETNADLITLGIGINDIGHGLTVEEFAKNYEAIISRLKADTGAIILVTNIPDISSAPQIPGFARRRYHQLIVDFNQRLAEIALRHQVDVFDIYTVTHHELPAHPEYISSDGFHPSDEGYELWAENMWPAIARHLGTNGQE